ncbi:hypothetical protein Tco_0551326 [Tanacetum coccineum]
MSYLVHAYYNSSPTRYYKDDPCWSADLKSKITEDIISIGSFVEALVLNQYVLVRKIFLREFTLSSLDVLQGFSFFLQMGFTLILATLEGLDVGLLGDIIGEDDCDDDG